MPCLTFLIALISPRLALFCVLIFSNDWFGKAYDSWFLPVLGFFLLPWTTLAYTVLWNIDGRGVNGIEWFFVGLAFIVDLASYGGAAKARES